MKKVILVKLFLVASLFATDYSSMSIDELSALRGNVPSEDREAFRSAMQSKMQSLSPDERASYRNKGNGQMLRDGSGNGGMYKGSNGKKGGR